MTVRAGRWPWLLVARHELWQHARRRSFVLTTLLIPVLGVLISLLTGLGGAAMARQLGSAFELAEMERVQTAARVGYVDPGGFIDRLPPVDAAVAVRAYAGEPDARAALRRGEVDVVYMLGLDYPRDLTVIRLAPTGALAVEDRAALYALLRANLWPAAGADTLSDLADPLRRVRIARVSPAAGQKAPLSTASLEEEPTQILLPMLLGVLLYSAIFMSSSFLLQSVTTEKENRLMELLLTSVPTTDLLTGKMLGLGILGLAQLTFWGLSGLLLTNVGMLALAQSMLGQLQPHALAWLPLYFVLGYAFYASLMASVGALVPSFQESGALTFAVLFPAWIPFFVLQLLLAEPNGTLARLLSLFPPTAPLVMLLRLSVTTVPPVDILLSLIMLILGTLAVSWGAARLFRVSLLLSGTSPSPRAVWRAIATRG